MSDRLDKPGPSSDAGFSPDFQPADLPVIVVPGFLGTQMLCGNRTLWPLVQEPGALLNLRLNPACTANAPGEPRRDRKDRLHHLALWAVERSHVTAGKLFFDRAARALATPIRRWRALGLAAGATAAVVILLALAPAAALGQEDRNTLIYSLRLAPAGARGSFLGQLSYNCDDFFAGGYAVQQDGRWVYADGDAPASGALNVGRRSGDTFIKGLDWQAEGLPPAPPPVRFADVGISIRGARIFVTARITTGQALFSAARRTAIAELHGVKTHSGPLVDQHKQPIPNTFSFTGSGQQLTMLPAMARALERVRCKDPRNRFSRPIKSGTSLGHFVFGVRPEKARGLAGSAQIETNVSSGSSYDAVTLEPTGGVTLKDNLLVAPIASGLPIPLACDSGDACIPSGSSAALGGGFDLVFQGRRATVAGLVLTTTGTGPDSLQQTLTGTLGGAAVTIFTGRPAAEGRTSFTSDFAQRAGAALGTDILGGIGVTFVFTRTGPN
jgi:hypothetical protein